MHSSEQSDALADGVVSADEMRDGIDRFGECLRKDGYELVDPIVDPFRGGPNYVYLARPLNPPGDTSIIDRCNIATVRFLEIAASATRTSKMDEAVRIRVLKCLRDGSVPTKPSDRSIEAVTDTAGEQHRDQVVACVTAAAAAVFPNVDPEVLGSY